MTNNDLPKTGIDEKNAIESAKRGILSYNLERDHIISKAIKQGNPETPLFVKRLDKQENDYYLVPWAIPEGVLLILHIDALSGNFLGARTLKKPSQKAFLKPEEAIALAKHLFIQNEINIPQLVWRPCRESTSPFSPLFRIKSKKKVIYIDMTGKIISKLTPLGLGG